MRLWEAATGKELRRFEDVPAWAAAAALSPDGKTVAVATSDRRVLLLDVDSGKVRPLGKNHPKPVKALAFSPDSKTLLTADEDRTLRLWDLASEKEIWQVAREAKWVTSVAFSPDGKVIAEGGGDGDPYLHDAATGQELRRLPTHSVRPVMAVTFGPDGKTVAAASQDGAVRLYDVATGKPGLALENLSGAVYGAAFSPDGKLLATSAGNSGTEGVTAVWDAATGKRLQKWEGGLGPVAFSPDGRLVAVGSTWLQRLHVWDVTTGQEQGPGGGYHYRLTDLAWSPDGKTVAAGGYFNPLYLWDAGTGKVIREQTEAGRDTRALAFSPDGSLLAGGSSLNTTVWDAATGKVRESFSGGGNSVAFSPDGKTVAGGAYGGVWTHGLGEANRDGGFAGDHNSAVLSVVFTPDGKKLAAGFQLHGVRVWNLETKQEETHPPPQDRSAYQALISPDHKHLAWFGQDTRLVLLDAATYRQRFYLGTHGPNDHPGLAFSPDSRMLAEGGKDGSVRVWEVASGQERIRFERHGGPIMKLAFSPDGRRLASSSADTTALVWDLTGRARDPAAAKLTAEELKSLWEDLDRDAARAYRAAWALAAAPADGVAFLKSAAAATPDTKRIKELIAALDDDEFAVREKATESLAALGKKAEAALREAAADSPSLEVKARARRLLKRLGAEGGEPQLPLRWLRAVEALELIDTDESREAIELVARNVDSSAVTEEARAALERAKRKKPSR